eukprot:jgi/Botrbrau1/8790/Bobra.0330s0021.1
MVLLACVQTSIAACCLTLLTTIAWLSCFNGNKNACRILIRPTTIASWKKCYDTASQIRLTVFNVRCRGFPPQYLLHNYFGLVFWKLLTRALWPHACLVSCLNPRHVWQGTLASAPRLLTFYFV